MWGALFRVLGAEFNTIGTFVALAFLVASTVFYHETLKFGISQSKFLLLLISAVLVAPFGAALLSAIEFGWPLTDVFTGKAGSSHLGGFILVVPVLMLVSRWQNV